MPMTDIAPRQCGHIVAATASVASHSRCAQVPQPRQTRSKFIPRRELTGTYFLARSTRVQRRPERQLAPEMQENRGNSRIYSEPYLSKYANRSWSKRSIS